MQSGHDCFSIKKLEKFTGSKVSVSHGGDVLWVPEVIAEAACAIDITDFPLDTHNCTLSVCSG